VAGLATAFGSGAMTNSIADLGESNCFLVTGSNTTENHPVISTVIKRAITQKGAKLIQVDIARIDQDQLGAFLGDGALYRPGQVRHGLAQAEAGHRYRLDQRHAQYHHQRRPFE